MIEKDILVGGFVKQWMEHPKITLFFTFFWFWLFNVSMIMSVTLFIIPFCIDYWFDSDDLGQIPLLLIGVVNIFLIMLWVVGTFGDSVRLNESWRPLYDYLCISLIDLVKMVMV